MAWNVDQTELFGGVARAPRVNPYIPARVERFGTTSDNPRITAAKDRGKPVKLSGDTVVLCADGDLPYGFIESIAVGTTDGYSICGVLSDPGHEVLAVDQVGNLAVGDVVVAGTPTAVGTATPALGPNVKKYVGAVASGQSALLTSGGLAIGTASAAAVKVSNTIHALVGGVLVTAAGAEVALTGIDIADGTTNVVGIFVNAAGTLSAVAGTAGATLAAVVPPQANATRALVGYVVIANASGDEFDGGTTLLSAANVTDTYINTLGAVAQPDVIAGPHYFQVLAYYGNQGAGKQVMLRKV